MTLEKYVDFNSTFVYTKYIVCLFVASCFASRFLSILSKIINIIPFPLRVFSQFHWGLLGKGCLQNCRVVDAHILMRSDALQ
jgi:hypothetical protein